MIRISIICALVACSTGLIAQTGASFPAGQQRVDVGRFLELGELLETSTDNVSAFNATYGPLNATGVPNLGMSEQVEWVRFEVRYERGSAPIVHLPYAELDHVRAYWAGDLDTVLLAEFGQAMEAATGTVGSGAFAFRLPRAEMHGWVYLAVESTKPVQLPLFLLSEEEFRAAQDQRKMNAGAYLGIMLVMILYNLFVFFSVRDRSYLFYVLYMACIMCAQLTLMGMEDILPWAGHTWLTLRASVLFTLASMLFASGFVQLFIGTRQVVPRLHSGMNGFMVLITAVLLLESAGLTRVAYQIAQGLSGLYSIYLVTTGVIAWRKGSRPAKFFLAAWSAFLLGAVAFILKDAGVLPYSALTTYAMPIGSAVEGVLLSFALADRINILRKEKEQSQAEALASAQENARITRDQNIILEQKVTERTEQLQLSLDQLKQAQSQLVEAEKMSSLGQLTAGIAHEINNPINYIRSNIPPLKRDMADLLEVLGAYRAHGAPQNVAALEQQLGLDETIQEVNDILRSMEEGANRTAEIVRGLRSFSRLDEGDLKAVDVNDGIRSTLNILSPQLKDRVHLELELNAAEAVECFPGKLNQVFMNMLNNAMQAVVARHGTQGGRIRVISEQGEGHTVISIMDNGVGMRPETRARVFEPFFTTKAVGEGTGLGLSIAHSIIEKHNGRIEVDSVENEGTIFRLILPNTQPMAVAKRA